MAASRQHSATTMMNQATYRGQGADQNSAMRSGQASQLLPVQKLEEEPQRREHSNHLPPRLAKATAAAEGLSN